MSSVKSGQADLQNLLKQKRVKIDPSSGEVENPQNPKTGKKIKFMKKVEGSAPYAIEIDEYAGSVKGEDSVWRISMHQTSMHVAGELLTATCPQEMYHEMTRVYNERKENGMKTDDFRPSLTLDERKSYNKWLEEKNSKESVGEESTEYTGAKRGRKPKIETPTEAI